MRANAGVSGRCGSERSASSTRSMTMLRWFESGRFATGRSPTIATRGDVTDARRPDRVRVRRRCGPLLGWRPAPAIQDNEPTSMNGSAAAN